MTTNPKKGKSKAVGLSKDDHKRISEMIRSMDDYEVASELKPLHPSQGANKWWNRETKKNKWDTLEHNGMVFPEAYVAHGVKLRYEGKEVDLNVEEEEVATYYAAMLETDHVKNETFNRNFFRDWTKVLKKSGKDKVIKDLSKCDFLPIARHLESDRAKKKEEKKNTKVKKQLKQEKDALNEIYGFAIVDGYREKVANFKVEPPGLFRGRGAHPKTGTLKRHSPGRRHH